MYHTGIERGCNYYYCYCYIDQSRYITTYAYNKSTPETVRKLSALVLLFPVLNIYESSFFFTRPNIERKANSMQLNNVYYIIASYHTSCIGTRVLLYIRCDKRFQWYSDSARKNVVAA